MGRHKYTKDEHLANGSKICWSRRIGDKVPVTCGRCGNERLLFFQNVTMSTFTGLCYSCSHAKSRKHTEAETLLTGSVVYWNERRGLGHNEKIRVQCGICNQIRKVAVYRLTQGGFTGYCVDCARTGSRSHFWKGGRLKHPSGYILIRLTPDHPFYEMADVHHLVPEHRLIMAEHIQRPLEKEEIVHHKNGVKDDNRIENLELLNRHLHHTGFRPG